MNKILDGLGKNVWMVARIIISAIVFVIGMVLLLTIDVDSEYIWLAVFLPCYILIGYDVVWHAMTNIVRGKIFDEYFLMTIATIGAFAIGEYPEAVAVMMFYQVGELFQTLATDKSRKSVAELMDIRPDYANVMRDGAMIVVDPFDVEVDEHIVIKPGERVPLDCIVIEGLSALDTSALTGEMMPLEVATDSEILSGSINIRGVITAKVTSTFSNSTATRILDLVESSSNNKSSQEAFITKFAKYYTPIVVIIALILAIIPPIIVGDWVEWIHRALTFLVVSCPCALVISVPMSFFAGIGNASRNGVLVKGGNYLEALASSKILVLDKTGTITKGIFSVTEILTVSTDEAELLEIAALAEGYSSHPIATSLRGAYGKELDLSRVSEVVEHAGYGITAVVDDKIVAIGSEKIMISNNIEYEHVQSDGSVCYVAQDGKYIGAIIIADKIKDNSREAIAKARAVGIEKVVMLTGDRASVADRVAREVGIDIVYSELLPVDKVEILEMLIAGKADKDKIIFVGDGINDAPVLSRADIGIAMGGVGSDSAVQSSDIVLMHDDLAKIADTIELARKTLVIVRTNIAFSLTVKLAVLILSAFGIGNMWIAVFADVGVSVIAILNAMRLIKYDASKKIKTKQ